MLAAYDGIATIEAAETTDAIDWRVVLSDALASNEVARKALSLMIDVQAAKARSAWVKEAREEGRAEGRAEGRKAGRAEGRKVGHAEGLRSSVAGVLAARGLGLSPAQRATLESCADVATLHRWTMQAAVAATTEEALR